MSRGIILLIIGAVGFLATFILGIYSIIKKGNYDITEYFRAITNDEKPSSNKDKDITETITTTETSDIENGVDETILRKDKRLNSDNTHVRENLSEISKETHDVDVTMISSKNKVIEETQVINKEKTNTMDETEVLK